MKIRDKIVIRKFLAEGNFREIINEIDLLLEHEQNAYLYHMKAQALYNCGKYNNSLECIRKAFQFSDPGNELFLLAGRIYFKLQYYKKAEEFYVHALKNHPDSPENLASYSFLLFITGRIKKAYILLERARKTEDFNVYTMINEAKISLYSAGYKEKAFLIEEILTRTWGDLFESINSALILRLNRNSRESLRILLKLGKQNPSHKQLIKTLITLCKIPPYFRRKQRDYSCLLYIALYVTALVLGSLYAYLHFGPIQAAIFGCSAAALTAVGFIVYSLYKIFSNKKQEG